MSKGSVQRPCNRQSFNDNFDRIFNKRDPVWDDIEAGLFKADISEAAAIGADGVAKIIHGALWPEGVKKMTPEEYAQGLTGQNNEPEGQQE